jgi:hypothetical protein
MFTSFRKREANRANAQKSTGAVTPEGKAKVSQNRLVHGLTGRFRVLPCENQDRYNELLDRFMEDEKPVGSVEVELVIKMARHTWQSERAGRFQEGCFIVDDQTPEQKENNQDTINVRGDLERYLRYQTHHDRAYQRASKELQERRKQRMKAELGFESQKRAEAAERRREKREIQGDDMHKVRYATAQARREGLEMRNVRYALAAAKHFDDVLPPESRKMAA